jgi:hypothetical protein
MAKLYITEYQILAPIEGSTALIPKETPAAEQVVDFTAGATASAAFNKATTFVRIHTDSICSVLFGTAPVASATANQRLTAGTTQWHGVPPNGSYKVSAIVNT